jgi:hypothetical protein
LCGPGVHVPPPVQSAPSILHAAPGFEPRVQTPAHFFDASVQIPFGQLSLFAASVIHWRPLFGPPSQVPKQA